MTEQCKLQKLIRHIHNVEDNSNIISNNLMNNGEFDLAKELLQNSRKHDLSKFEGIEWEHIFNGKEDPLFFEAVKYHIKNNPHHPEYWDSIHNMPRVYLAEMVADWKSRSEEFGSDLIRWIEESASIKYNFHKYDIIYKEIYEFVNMIVEPAFV